LHSSGAESYNGWRNMLRVLGIGASTAIGHDGGGEMVVMRQSCLIVVAGALLVLAAAPQEGQGKVLETEAIRIVRDGKLCAQLQGTADGAQLVLYANGVPAIRLTSGKSSRMELVNLDTKAAWYAEASDQKMMTGVAVEGVPGKEGAMLEVRKHEAEWISSGMVVGSNGGFSAVASNGMTVLDFDHSPGGKARLTLDSDGQMVASVQTNASVSFTSDVDSKDSVQVLQKRHQGIQVKATSGRRSADWTLPFER